MKLYPYVVRGGYRCPTCKTLTVQRRGSIRGGKHYPSKSPDFKCTECGRKVPA